MFLTISPRASEFLSGSILYTAEAAPEGGYYDAKD